MDGPRKSYELTLGNRPHEGARGYLGQMAWLEACLLYTFVVLAMGRRAGKTTLVPFVFLEDMAQLGPEFYVAAYMSQGHPQSKEMFRACLEAWEGANLVTDSHQDEGQDRWIELRGINDCTGAKIYFVSGESTAHPGFHGKGLHRAVIDEASLTPMEAFYQTIVPMLAGGGKALVIGSPYPEGEGFAWFEDIWKKGEVGGERRDENYLSFNAPTECNPTLSDKMIGILRAACQSKEDELCLFDGLFAKDTGVVFTHLKTTFSLPCEEVETNRRWVGRAPRLGEPVAIGLDFGESEKGDATIAAAFSLETFDQLEVIRLRGVLYEDQVPILDEFYRRMGPNTIVVADGRAHGGHVVSVLRQRYGNWIHVVKWANGGQFDKASCVHHGIHLCQSTSKPKVRTWHLLQIAQQEDEFRCYGKKPLPSGGWKYGAPSGKHDDWVSACLFASYRLPLVEDVVVSEATREDLMKYDLTLAPIGTIANHELLLETQAYENEDGTYTLH